jgi:DinB family protein
MLADLDAADSRAAALAQALTVPQLNWRRRPEEWSVGQCLDHLVNATDVYLPPMTRSLADRPHGTAATLTLGWLGGWFIRNYIEPSGTTKRGRAPRKIAPSPQIDGSVLQRFLRSNEQARDFVRQAAQYDVNRIRFRNPFVPLLRFTVGTGLTVLTRHQHRHLDQAERIRAAPGFPQP